MTTTAYTSGTQSGLDVTSGNEVDFTGTAIGSSTLVEGGGSIVVINGGATVGTMLYGDIGQYGPETGTETVGSGGTDTGSMIYMYGSERVSGGTVTTAAISGGSQYVYAGSVSSTTIGLYQRYSGRQYVSGGTVVATTVGNSCFQLVYGGSVSTTTLLGAEQDIYGGTVAGTTISGGQQTVYAGAVTSTTILGGEQLVSGGTVSATIIGDARSSIGAVQIVSGGTVVATTIDEGGEQDVSGGTVTSTFVNAGMQVVSTGGTVTATTIGPDGQQIISGGLVSGTMVSGGTQIISAGATAYDTQVNAGGTIQNDGSLVFDQGTLLVESGTISGAGSLTLSGAGTLRLDGDNAYTGGTILDAGKLILGSQGAAGTGPITFGGVATLQIDTASGPVNVVSGFAPGDAIDLETLAYSAADTVSIDGDTVTVGTQGGSIALDIAGASSTGFILVGAADGSVLLEASACFAAGTMIDTPTGEVAVERIAPGDLVGTLAGPRPVVWTGRRSVEVARLADPETGWLVRVRRDAVADGVPHRDLLITQEHCLYLKNRLIPVRMLVNDRSILLDRSIGRYEYHHLELERHGILIAEGLTTESYLDTGNRGNFANAPVPALTPSLGVDAGHHRWTTHAAAPLAVDRDTVEPVWNELVERAGRLDGAGGDATVALTERPDLRLLLEDGGELASCWQDGALYMFHIPNGKRAVRLLSRSAVPAEVIGPFVDDRRRLGVAIDRLVLWQGLEQTTMPAATIDLPGWHAVEGASRWTNGKAVLDLPIAGTDTVLDVHVVAVMRCRDDTPRDPVVLAA